MTEYFGYLLTTTLLQGLFVATGRCHYGCPRCHLHQLAPERIALFNNHKTPSCTRGFDNSFFLKRHLDADALNSPSPPQSSHLELQSEQQGTESATGRTSGRPKTDKGRLLRLESLSPRVRQVCNSHCRRNLTLQRNCPHLLLSNRLSLQSRFLGLLVCLPFANRRCCSMDRI